MTTPIQAAREAAGPEAVLVGVIGSPIAHSLSPTLHRAAFRALDLTSWQSFAYEIPPGHANEALDELRSAGLRGLSVTMPHKADVAALVDECSDVARRLDAVNCVVNNHGVLSGHNTDGLGFVASLERGAGFLVSGRRCLVLGAGGAARAVVLALADHGAAEVAVMNRTPSRAADAAALAGSAGVLVEVGDTEAVATAVAGAELVVNATPVGMTDGGGGENWLISPDTLHPGQVAADLVYVPRPTAWLVAAADRGLTTVDGLGMLVHQAAAQIELWTGHAAPVAAMWESVTA